MTLDQLHAGAAQAKLAALPYLRALLAGTRTRPAGLQRFPAKALQTFVGVIAQLESLVTQVTR